MVNKYPSLIQAEFDLVTFKVEKSSTKAIFLHYYNTAPILLYVSHDDEYFFIDVPKPIQRQTAINC